MNKLFLILVLLVTFACVFGDDKKEPSIEKKELSKQPEPRQSSQGPEKPESTDSEGDNSNTPVNFNETDEETNEDKTDKPEEPSSSESPEASEASESPEENKEKNEDILPEGKPETGKGQPLPPLIQTTKPANPELEVAPGINPRFCRPSFLSRLSLFGRKLIPLAEPSAPVQAFAWPFKQGWYPQSNYYWPQPEPWIKKNFVAEPIYIQKPPVVKYVKQPVFIKQPIQIYKQPVIHKQHQVDIHKKPPVYEEVDKNVDYSKIPAEYNRDNYKVGW